MKKIIFECLKNNKFITFTSILLIIVGIVFSIVPALILKELVNGLTSNIAISRLLVLSFIYVSIYLISALIDLTKGILIVKLGEELSFLIRNNLLNHISNLPYTTLINESSPSLEAYFNNDVKGVNSLFSNGFIDLFSDLFKMISILITLFIYSIYFGLIILILLPILIVITYVIKNKMFKIQYQTRKLEANINSKFYESMNNMLDLKINKANNYAKTRYSDSLNSHYVSLQKSNFFDAFFPVLMQIIKNLTLASLLLLSNYKGEVFNLSIGVVVSSISLISDLFSPIENITVEIQTIQASLASYSRIDKFLKLEEMNKKQVDDINSFDIEFENVFFKYDKKDVISNFNLKISQGERIVLVGESGVGKTTLMNLALGILKPNSGNVLIGNKQSYEFNSELRNKTFAIIYQNPFFSNMSIYDEISLLNKNISKKDVLYALSQVGLSYIKNLDDILNPNSYSSGELALFNIARILLLKPKILFLDEMNASIDPYTNKKIITLINKLFNKCTIFSINHYGIEELHAKVIELKKVKE